MRTNMENSNKVVEKKEEQNAGENDKMLPSKKWTQTEDDFEERYKQMALTEETSCGMGFLQGPLLQRFANKKAYVVLYGVVGCIYSATYAYFNGTITTLEKRFKIPSKTTGLITVGNDISALFASMIVSYYAGRGHRPRWIAVGLYSVVMFCLLTALPHLLYGPGTDALRLTTEHGAVYDQNATIEVLNKQKRKLLCQDGDGVECDTEEGSLAPQILLFAAQAISGIGGSLYYTLGVSYMDDNTKKSKTPALISFSYFLRMLGPAVGYGLASLCLKFYISPTLTPTIDTTDPRWLGAWWMGWLILGSILILFATLIGLFPKTLPRAAMRKSIAAEKLKHGLITEVEPEIPASLKDMIVTFKRLLYNKTLMLNNLASVFYFFGYMAYWIFLPKYIETQYKQSASTASFVTGTVGLVFSAFGILLAGVVISKFRPSARSMAAWNVLVGGLSVVWMILFVFLGCPANDNNIIMNPGLGVDTPLACSASCGCEYVPYSPVCSSDGLTTYISACHAGCHDQITVNNTKKFTQCSCIQNATVSPREPPLATTPALGVEDKTDDNWSFALPGSCPVDCSHQFYIFLGVVCLMKFSGATGRASNFLVSVRCVEEKDKPVSMGFGLMVMSLFSFVPAPIFFGAVMDRTCLVWGKTCSGTGNCWLYDVQSLRYIMNLTAAAFVSVGTLFDVGVWYCVKDLQIYDDDEEGAKDREMKVLRNGGPDTVVAKGNGEERNGEANESLLKKQNGLAADAAEETVDKSKVNSEPKP